MSDTCPLCGSDLQGEEIPEEYRATYSGGRTHYSRVIGIDGGHAGIYDGVVAWTCPDCEGWWHRFPEGDHRRDRVEKVMA